MGERIAVAQIIVGLVAINSDAILIAVDSTVAPIAADLVAAHLTNLTTDNLTEKVTRRLSNSIDSAPANGLIEQAKIVEIVEMIKIVRLVACHKLMIANLIAHSIADLVTDLIANPVANLTNVQNRAVR